MAIDDIDRTRRQLAVSSDDYRDAAGEYARYLLRARERFERGEAATTQEVRRVYRRAAKKLRKEIESVTAGTLRERHLLAVTESLERMARTLNDEMLQAITSGIRLSVDAATDAHAQITLGITDDLFERTGVQRLFGNVNERAVLALLSRTGPDGLQLSDRVWRVSQNSRSAIRRVVEDGVARGLDARKLARQVDQYVKKGARSTLAAETRRRLKVPSKVSHEAMRLAVTEINNAFHEGSIRAAEATPGYQGMLWRLSAQHVIVDICDEYATHNGTGVWPPGQVPPKGHPWCRCVICTVLEDRDDFTARLRDWLRDPGSQQDIEQWFKTTARPFLNRP